MRVLFVGTPDVAVAPLRALLESEHQVVGVLTRTDARAGRGRKLVSSPVAQVAEEAGLPVIKADSLKQPEVLAQILDLGPQVAIVVAYGALIPLKALEALPMGWLNLHFSALPRWRGAAPVQRAIQAGDEEIGLSVFMLDEGLDTGPLYARRKYPLDPDATTGQVLSELSETGARVILNVLEQIKDGSVMPMRQKEAGMTLAPKLDSSDTGISFEVPAVTVKRRINAVTPAPGAWTLRHQPDSEPQRLKLEPVMVLDEAAPSDLLPGSLVVSKRSVSVVCADNTMVELSRVAPAGKGWMNAADWARGAHLGEQDRLGVTLDA
ncbi:methionyl-tRNA formyltransferase [Boudabousia liubingyangii]|uniref:methionyl-tRNA formyltransferase n=1 Tax=Boudabousia liubingyangii TaxID=1921764 RepID=UPI00093C6D9A|nr:methionyl-tRNA formyltransferase [Boudabousia liubingyangii]OKL47693.1 methionyl-tRNA formyltransferase [Boudabousia liubingyangii]